MSEFQNAKMDFEKIKIYIALQWLLLFLKSASSESRRYSSSNDVFGDIFEGSTFKQIYNMYSLVRRLATPLGFDFSVGKHQEEYKGGHFGSRQMDKTPKHPRLDLERGDVTLVDVKLAPNLDRARNYLKSRDVYLKVKQLVGKAAAFMKGFQAETDIDALQEKKSRKMQKREKLLKRQEVLLNDDEVMIQDTDNEEREPQNRRKRRKQYTDGDSRKSLIDTSNRN